MYQKCLVFVSLYLLYLVIALKVDLVASVDYVHMGSMKMRDSITRTTNSKPHPDTMHELTFAIKKNNVDKLHDMLMERSTPGRPLYQQWMSNDEVRAVTSNPEAADAVMSWFSENGIVVDWVNRGQEYFRVRSRISTWEHLLRTTFHEFSEHIDKKHVKAVRAETYALPSTIAHHVHTVFGAVDFPVPIRKLGSLSSATAESHVSSDSRDRSMNTVEKAPLTTEATATAVNGYVQFNIYASSTCADSAFQAVDYAIGPCIPQSLTPGSNSAKFSLSGSAALLTTYSDIYCSSVLIANQSLPMPGVCSTFYSQNVILTVSSSSNPPNPPFFATISEAKKVMAYEGFCSSTDSPIVVEFYAENGNIACEPLVCSTSDYKQYGFLAPLNVTIACLSASAGTTTPLTLEKQYGIPIRNGSIDATQSVFATVNEFFSYEDLLAFQASYGLSVQTLNVKQGHSTASCIGAAPCGEANLDVQYITGLSQDTNTTFWYIYNTTSVDPFLLYLIELTQLDNPPLVTSISYGKNEQYYSPEFLDLYAQGALQAGLMGLTIVVASGDDGVGGDNSRRTKCNPDFAISIGNCACNASSSSVDFESSKYSQTKNSWSGYGYFPSFPASCPYVTVVGATQLQSHTSGPEIVCSSQTGSSITSGGGFSSYYASLDWQTVAVAGYFQQVSSGAIPTPASGYNPLGRGIPDVSFNGDSFNIILNGFSVGESGTSASAPSFAAMISTINGARLAAGKGPVGFINPSLYANVDLFNDITSGNNKCSASVGGSPICCNSGFYASTGWDPTTGLGSIQYSNLYKILVDAPTSPDLHFAPTRSPVSPPNSGGGSNSKLSAGAVAGIVIAVLIAVGLLIAGVGVYLGFISFKTLSVGTTRASAPERNDYAKATLIGANFQSSSAVSNQDDHLISSSVGRESFGVASDKEEL